MKFPEKEWLKVICKLGSGSECCRYLMCGSNGWECGKENKEFKCMIDARVKAGLFAAKGDCCEGPNSFKKVLN
jgi:hypothetical protein